MPDNETTRNLPVQNLKIMSASKVLLGMAAGFAVGAAAGILLAPDSGENTRRKLSEKGEDFAADLRIKFDQFLDEFVDRIDPPAEEDNPQTLT